MIKTGSPHYLTIPRMSPSDVVNIPSSYRLELFIWSGLKSAVPVSANATITKKNPLELQDDTNIDISDYE